jgi:hypothetical protein
MEYRSFYNKNWRKHRKFSDSIVFVHYNSNILWIYRGKVGIIKVGRIILLSSLAGEITYVAKSYGYLVIFTWMFCMTGRLLTGCKCWNTNPLTPELNPSAQRCLTRFSTGDFASWTVNFFNISVKNQQTQQLFIQFINYLWYLLHVSALNCHPQGAFLVPSERCSIEEQSLESCEWACCF